MTSLKPILALVLVCGVGCGKTKQKPLIDGGEISSVTAFRSSYVPSEAEMDAKDQEILRRATVVVKERDAYYAISSILINSASPANKRKAERILCSYFPNDESRGCKSK